MKNALIALGILVGFVVALGLLMGVMALVIELGGVWGMLGLLVLAAWWLVYAFVSDYRAGQ